jgi:hypothetical protein
VLEEAATFARVVDGHRGRVGAGIGSR